jgi:hypothetical protein
VSVVQTKPNGGLFLVNQYRLFRVLMGKAEISLTHQSMDPHCEKVEAACCWNPYSMLPQVFMWPKSTALQHFLAGTKCIVVAR